jgi:hypothetical protein
VNMIELMILLLTRESLLMGKAIMVYLLVLTRLDRHFLIDIFFILMRRSTVLSLPFQLGFPV